MLFDFVDKLGIEFMEIVILETIAIWWIGDNSSSRCHIILQEVHGLKVDAVSDSGTESIPLRYCDHIIIHIRSEDAVDPCEFLVSEILFHFHMCHPVVEGEIHESEVPFESRSDIACHERCLYR